MSEQAVYRCPLCGTHEHLYGVAGANIFGAILADGSVSEDDSIQYETFESSIMCTAHPGHSPAIEKYVGGAWCRWVYCLDCEGRGERRATDRYGTEIHGYVCWTCEGTGGEYRPITADAASRPNDDEPATHRQEHADA
jgi:hypothetical protein